MSVRQVRKIPFASPAEDDTVDVLSAHQRPHRI